MVSIIKNYSYIQKEFTSGKYSKIHIGFDNDSGKQVIVKIINITYLKPYILAEIENLKYCKHPNIVNLIDDIWKDDKCYLIMDYCEQGTLKQYFRCKSLDLSTRKYFAKQLIETIQFMHNKNIIHRDIKPDNILVHKNQLVLADFGFAKRLKDNELTETLCGSPLYMAPEILEEKTYNKSIDIWSIGVVLYEIFYERHPYECKTKDILLDKIVYNKLELSCDEERGYPLDFFDLLQQCLSYSNRISINEILSHPGYTQFLDNKSENDINVDTSISEPINIPISSRYRALSSYQYNELKTITSNDSDEPSASNSAPNDIQFISNYMNSKIETSNETIEHHIEGSKTYRRNSTMMNNLSKNIKKFKKVIVG